MTSTKNGTHLGNVYVYKINMRDRFNNHRYAQYIYDIIQRYGQVISQEFYLGIFFCTFDTKNDVNETNTTSSTS